eukprot:gene25241-30296_t
MNLIRSYNNWRRYRDTVTELNRLSARELNDLGISRGDIAFVAKKAAAARSERSKAGTPPPSRPLQIAPTEPPPAVDENTGRSLISRAGALNNIHVFDGVSRSYCTAFCAPGVSGTFDGTAFWVRDLGGGTKCVSFAGDRASAVAFGLLLVLVLVLVLQAARARRGKTAKGNAM